MLSPEELIQEAKAQGYKFIRHDYYNSPKCGCAVGVLGMLAGLLPSQLYAQTIAQAIEIGTSQLCEIVADFDSGREDNSSYGTKLAGLVTKNKLWST